MHSERRHFVLLCGGAVRWKNPSLLSAIAGVTVSCYVLKSGSAEFDNGSESQLRHNKNCATCFFIRERLRSKSLIRMRKVLAVILLSFVYVRTDVVTLRTNVDSVSSLHFIKP